MLQSYIIIIIEWRSVIRTEVVAPYCIPNDLRQFRATAKRRFAYCSHARRNRQFRKRTPCKCVIANTSNAIMQLYRRQSCIGERITVNLLQRLRNIHARQVRTTGECRTAHRRQAFRQYHLRQAFTAVKSTPTDDGHCTRNNHLRQRTHLVAQISRNTLHILTKRKRRDLLQCRITIIIEWRRIIRTEMVAPYCIPNDLRQFRAAAKCRFAYCSHARRNRHLGKRTPCKCVIANTGNAIMQLYRRQSCIGERITVNLLQRLRNIHARQVRTTGECRTAHRRQAFRQYHLRQAFTAVKSTPTDDGHCTRNNHLRQRTHLVAQISRNTLHILTKRKRRDLFQSCITIFIERSRVVRTEVVAPYRIPDN